MFCTMHVVMFWTFKSPSFSSGCTHEASFYGQTTVIVSLLEFGANVEAKNELGWTPLHFSVREGHLEVVRLLLDCGAHVNAQKKDHSSSLHFTVGYGHVKVIEVLLNHGADPHIQINKANRTFLLASVQNRTNME